MRRGLMRFRWLALVLIGAICSCASPKAELTSVWKDQAYQGGYFKNILVISANQKEALRNFSEDEFVRQLKGRGATATASFTVIPFGKALDKAFVAEKVKGMSVDAILVARVLYTLTDAPPLRPQPNWNEFYSDSFGYEKAGPTGPKVSPGKMKARIEMNLYEKRTEKPVWSASSDLPVKEDPRDDIKAFITLVIGQLAKERLIP